MTLEEQKQIAIDYYVNLMRIKAQVKTKSLIIRLKLPGSNFQHLVLMCLNLNFNGAQRNK